MNRETTERQRSRRSILTGALRCLTLGALAAAGALTVAKRRRLVAEGKCVGDGLCNRCAVLAECGLPLALAAKDSQRGGNGRTK